MKTLIVYGHPRYFISETQKEPIRNKMIVDALSKLPNVTYKDLYVMLNGKADFTEEQKKTEIEEIKKYDRIIIQTPLFWFNISHIAKLYLDQILTVTMNDLKGKELGVIFTSGAKINELPPVEEVAFTFRMSAEFCQMKNAKSFIFGSDEGEEKIKEIVAEYSK